MELLQFVGVLSSPRGGDQARPCGHVGLQGNPGVVLIENKETMMYDDIPSQSLTWNLKMAPWNRRFLLETIPIFWFHVKLGECIIISHITDRILYRISQRTIHLSIGILFTVSINLSIYIHPSFIQNHAQTKTSKVRFFLVSESPKRSGLFQMIGTNKTHNKFPAFLPSPNRFFFLIPRHWLHCAAICAIPRPDGTIPTKVEIPKLQERNTHKNGWEKPQLYRNSH